MDTARIVVYRTMATSMVRDSLYNYGTPHKDFKIMLAALRLLHYAMGFVA